LLAEITPDMTVDNIEAIAVIEIAGETRLFLMSDDNFNARPAHAALKLRDRGLRYWLRRRRLMSAAMAAKATPISVFSIWK
jgi:hypothetical protein